MVKTLPLDLKPWFCLCWSQTLVLFMLMLGFHYKCLVGRPQIWTKTTHTQNKTKKVECGCVLQASSENIIKKHHLIGLKNKNETMKILHINNKTTGVLPKWSLTSYRWLPLTQHRTTNGYTSSFVNLVARSIVVRDLLSTRDSSETGSLFDPLAILLAVSFCSDGFLSNV